MQQYLDLLQDILDMGTTKGDRTGTGTLSTFGKRMEFDLVGGKLPLLTTKEVITRSIVHELLWMISGDTNIRYLKENNVSIWDSWLIPGTEEYVDMSVEECLETVAKVDAEKAENWRFQLMSPERPHLEIVYEIAEWLGEQGLPYRKLVGGDIGKGYGRQWRNWEDVRVIDQSEREKYLKLGFELVSTTLFARNQAIVQRKVDQLADVIHQLKHNPDSRRIIVSAWNVANIDEMALPPCHSFFQFWTREMTVEERVKSLESRTLKGSLRVVFDEKANEEERHTALDCVKVPRRALSCQLYQRSADTPLGLPFNIVQYSLLTHLIGQAVGMEPEKFVWVGGDTHIYSNQVEGVKEQLKRTPLEATAQLRLNPDITDLFDFKFEDISIVGYEYQSRIKFPVAV